jgi:amino acid transporter
VLAVLARRQSDTSPDLGRDRRPAGLVALSYRQTVFAYPNGGGSYTVAKDNLGAMPGLVARGAADGLHPDGRRLDLQRDRGDHVGVRVPRAHTVLLCTVSIVVLMLVNLRGVRESGMVFSVPTYVFIALMLLLIVVGIAKLIGSHVVAASTRA